MEICRRHPAPLGVSPGRVPDQKDNKLEAKNVSCRCPSAECSGPEDHVEVLWTGGLTVCCEWLLLVREFGPRSVPMRVK